MTRKRLPCPQGSLSLLPRLHPGLTRRPCGFHRFPADLCPLRDSLQLGKKQLPIRPEICIDKGGKYFKWKQVIAIIGMADIGRPPDAHTPRCHPAVECILRMSLKSP